MVDLLIDPALRVWHKLGGDGVAAVQKVGRGHVHVAHEVHQRQAEGRVGRPLVEELFAERVVEERVLGYQLPVVQGGGGQPGVHRPQVHRGKVAILAG